MLKYRWLVSVNSMHRQRLTKIENLHGYVGPKWSQTYARESGLDSDGEEYDDAGEDEMQNNEAVDAALAVIDNEIIEVE